MLLDVALHTYFDSYAWCIHPTARSVFCREILYTYTLEKMSRTNIQCTGSVPSLLVWRISQVQFQDRSQTGIQDQLLNPALIVLHSTAAHVLYLSDATKVIDSLEIMVARKISLLDLLIGLSTNNHQLPTNPHG